MTALAADAYVKSRKASIIAYPLADNVKIYKGSLVSLHAGYLVPAADTSGDVCVGIAEEQADNTVTGHSAGAIKCRVRSGERFVGLTASGMAQSNVGATVYVSDSGTVALSTTNSVHVGRIVFYNSATSVDVFIPFGGVGS